MSKDGNPRELISLAKEHCKGCKFYYGNKKSIKTTYVGCELGYYPVFVNNQRIIKRRKK